VPIAAGARDIIVASDSNPRVYTSSEIGARATVVPHHTFDYKVKHKIQDPDHEPTDIRTDPINILGPVLDGHIPVVTNSDPTSLLAAFNKRCNFLADTKDNIADKEFKMALDLVASLPDLFTDDPWLENDVDRARWLKKFDQPKADRMCTAWNERPDTTLRDIRNKTLMVKIETLLKRDDAGWAPRAVYVGSDAHNCITGPPMMVAMERWQALLDDDADGSLLGPVSVRFAYKRDDTYLCEHLSRDATLTNVCEGDFSRNDREQRQRVALIIDAVLHKLNFPEEFRKLMVDSSESYDVYASMCGLKATLQHQLPTGTTATTFRNSVFNPVMFAVACRQQKITRARANILGDDILAVTLQRMNLNEWINCVDRFKMVLKAFAPDLNGQATFLSRRLIMNTKTPCMIPKIGKTLARFNVRACKNPALSDDAYMAGKSLAHAYEFRHAPPFVSMFVRRFKYHYARMNDHEKQGDVQHDSWFLKISGLTKVDDILTAAEKCSVKVRDHELSDWTTETYSTWYTDLLQFCEKVITTPVYMVLDDGIINDLIIDM
jgi:hypothetical protein